MKRILFLLCLLFAIPASAQIPLIGFISTNGPASYPTHLDTLGKGGYMAVSDIISRNAIPTARRKQGMMVYTVADSTAWVLRGGITNTNWKVFTAGSLAFTDSTSVDLNEATSTLAVINQNIKNAQRLATDPFVVPFQWTTPDTLGVNFLHNWTSQSYNAYDDTDGKFYIVTIYVDMADGTGVDPFSVTSWKQENYTRRVNILSEDGVSNTVSNIDPVTLSRLKLVNPASTIGPSTTYTAGSNITITGTNPYVISATGGGSIAGTGTTNTIPLFTGSTTLGNSIITQSGTIATVSGQLNISNSGTTYGAWILNNASNPTLSTATTLRLKNNNSSGVTNIGFENASSFFGQIGLAPIGALNYSSMMFLNTTNRPIRMSTNDGGRTDLMIAQNGKVGIGLTPTTYNLDVLGSLHTSGTNTLSDLAGTGIRQVVVNDTGKLSTQTIPTIWSLPQIDSVAKSRSIAWSDQTSTGNRIWNLSNNSLTINGTNQISLNTALAGNPTDINWTPSPAGPGHNVQIGGYFQMGLNCTYGLSLGAGTSGGDTTGNYTGFPASVDIWSKIINLQYGTLNVGYNSSNTNMRGQYYWENIPIATTISDSGFVKNSTTGLMQYGKLNTGLTMFQVDSIAKSRSLAFSSQTLAGFTTFNGNGNTHVGFGFDHYEMSSGSGGMLFSTSGSMQINSTGSTAMTIAATNGFQVATTTGDIFLTAGTSGTKTLNLISHKLISSADSTEIGNIANTGTIKFNGKLHLGGTYGTSTNSVVEITSTTKGFMPPRMTATQASAISVSSTDEGMMVYVTTTDATFTSKGWWGYNGATWEKLNN